MSEQARDDLYRLAELLGEMDCLLNPLLINDNDYKVEPNPPPPLPPTGLPERGGAVEGQQRSLQPRGASGNPYAMATLPPRKLFNRKAIASQTKETIISSHRLSEQYGRESSQSETRFDNKVVDPELFNKSQEAVGAQYTNRQKRTSAAGDTNKSSTKISPSESNLSGRVSKPVTLVDTEYRESLAEKVEMVDTSSNRIKKSLSRPQRKRKPLGVTEASTTQHKRTKFLRDSGSLEHHVENLQQRSFLSPVYDVDRKQSNEHLLPNIYIEGANSEGVINDPILTLKWKKMKREKTQAAQAKPRWLRSYKAGLKPTHYLKPVLASRSSALTNSERFQQPKSERFLSRLANQQQDWKYAGIDITDINVSSVRTRLQQDHRPASITVVEAALEDDIIDDWIDIAADTLGGGKTWWWHGRQHGAIDQVSKERIAKRVKSRYRGRSIRGVL